jgi:hypothetical protein
MLQLDFSQFHPLDHFPGTRRCRSLPGGTLNHLVMDWQYRRQDQLRALTLCKIGRHGYGGVWQVRDDEDRKNWRDREPDFEVCQSCGKDKP